MYILGLSDCSDVICDFPLKEMLAFHKEKGAEGTILVTRVGCRFITIDAYLLCSFLLYRMPQKGYTAAASEAASV